MVLPVRLINCQRSKSHNGPIMLLQRRNYLVVKMVLHLMSLTKCTVYGCTLFFMRMLFFRSRLNILIVLSILG